MTNKILKKSLQQAATGMALALCLPFTAAAAESQMAVGGRTSQPIGHYEYCRKNLRDCSIVSRSTAPMKLTRARWKEIVEANVFANGTIEPVTDLDYYGTEEYWIAPQTHGDCEDYVLLKRQYLMARGWPASALLVTVVKQPNGDGHAVLTVRTDRADYILDNLNDKILPWHQTVYTYLKRQAASHSGQWEDIIDSRRLVGSVN